VNISSVAARLGPPGEAAYSATKAALSAFSESAHVDLADTGVKFLIVNPGVIDTRLFQLPDNDESSADIEALPTSAMVEPVLDALRNDLLEINVPDWFGDIFASKFKDPNAYIGGTIAWDREKRAQQQ
jgi:NAD(P)-dependent dehydrogenase (short-subunit alcohol dehydrogenase family)